VDLKQARTLLGGQWPAIVGAVYDPVVRSTPGGVQQYVWASLRQEYLSKGEPLPVGSFAAINRLLSLAGQQRAAGLALSSALAQSERTGLGVAISSVHIAPSINAAEIQNQPLGPQYKVVYETQHIIEGEAQLTLQTHDLGYELPQSLADLQEQVEIAAQIEAADYGYEWGGVATPISIQSY
jgi:hypothetical protein